MSRPTTFAIAPPIEPMLARLAEQLPAGDGFLYEPKWDGFRAIVFRGKSEVFIQSRDLRPLDRYFPELHEAFMHALPDGCVMDGEIVIAEALHDDPALRSFWRSHPAVTPLDRGVFDGDYDFAVPGELEEHADHCHIHSAVNFGERAAAQRVG